MSDKNTPLEQVMETPIDLKPLHDALCNENHGPSSCTVLNANVLNALANTIARAVDEAVSEAKYTLELGEL